MTTQTLSEAGQKLADALRQARVLHSWNHVSTAALNTAAALLLTAPEGEGAGLRVALELVGGYLGTVRECCPAGPGSWHLMRAQAVVKAALASPQPAVQGPVAAGVEKAPAFLREFGAGKLKVDTGTAYGRPAVFIANVLGEPGVIGDLVAPAEQGDLASIEDGEGVFIFPTMEQAEAVKAALVNIAPTPADPKTPDAGVGDEAPRTGCSKWGPGFPPSSCNAWEDCAHDGWCHDQDQCQIKGPAEPDEDDEPAPVGEDETGVREALADMLAGWRYIREHHGDLYGVGWDRAEQKAAAALAPQPPKAETPAGVGEALNAVKAVADDLAQVCVDEGDSKAAGALQFISGFVSDRLFELAALSTAPAARPGDEVSGFVLVPTKITHAMADDLFRTTWPVPTLAQAQKLWDAALAAAPAADGGLA